jgi:hypothetical protein
MKVEKARASNWKNLPREIQDSMIYKAQSLGDALIPVNDVFFDEWENKNAINLYYGSFGSGKSIFIADILIKHCLEDEYFRCYYGRKVLDKVRGSVFQTLVDRIEDLKLARLFSYSKATNGSMVITCRHNGNVFIPFGADNTSNLKSIKDPTHFFMEEIDQFTFTDFGYIFSRLRTGKSITQLYGAFNTEKIYLSHWLRKVFFDGEYKDQCKKIKINYNQNHFIDQESYFQRLKLIANGNASVLNAIAHGEWGTVRTGNEFWKNFDESRHVKDISYNPGALWISLDENVNPYVTATLWQADMRIKTLKQVHEITSETPNNNAPRAAREMITWLEEIAHTDIIFVCGDPSGKHKSTIDENSASFFDKYIYELREAGYRVRDRVMRSAPQVSLSGAFINEIYERSIFGWSILINSTCHKSIYDYIVVKEDAEGKMFKAKIKDPETGVTYEPDGHLSDSARYVIITILEKEFDEYRNMKSNVKDYVGYF